MDNVTKQLVQQLGVDPLAPILLADHLEKTDGAREMAAAVRAVYPSQWVLVRAADPGLPMAQAVDLVQQAWEGKAQRSPDGSVSAAWCHVGRGSPPDTEETITLAVRVRDWVALDSGISDFGLRRVSKGGAFLPPVLGGWAGLRTWAFVQLEDAMLADLGRDPRVIPALASLWEAREADMTYPRKDLRLEAAKLEAVDWTGVRVAFDRLPQAAVRPAPRRVLDMVLDRWPQFCREEDREEMLLGVARAFGWEPERQHRSGVWTLRHHDGRRCNCCYTPYWTDMECGPLASLDYMADGFDENYDPDDDEEEAEGGTVTDEEIAAADAVWHAMIEARRVVEDWL